MGLRLILGNKNYSSWSMRAWLLLRFANDDKDCDDNGGPTVHGHFLRLVSQFFKFSMTSVPENCISLSADHHDNFAVGPCVDGPGLARLFYIDIQRVFHSKVRGTGGTEQGWQRSTSAQWVGFTT